MHLVVHAIVHLEVLFNIRIGHSVRCEAEPGAVFYDRMGVRPHVQPAAVAPVYAQLVAGEEYSGVAALLKVHRGAAGTEEDLAVSHVL